MFLVHPTHPTRVYVTSSILFLEGYIPSGHPEFISAILISVKARLGYDLEFQVLLENGALRDKLPISALSTKPSKSHYPQDVLQRWCCPANYLTVTQLPLTSGKVWIKGEQLPFSYHFTVDMVHCGPDVDLGDSHVSDEHKSMHIIELECGSLAAMPNNSLVFDHPTLIPADKQLKNNPGYCAAQDFPCSEHGKLAKPSISANIQFYDSPASLDEQIKQALESLTSPYTDEDMFND